MNIIKLSLPLQYKKLPEYFDAWNINEDTEDKNAIIEKLLKAHNTRTILDLTCGTGSQIFFLAERNYIVTGADFSPALLEIAKTKARHKKVDVKFIEGDMRTLKVGTFDAVITIFNAIGHLTKTGMEKALKNIYNNLKDGGIYIFDILNLEAMTEEAIFNLACFVHKKINDTQILASQCSTLDKEKGILTSYDNFLIQKNAGKPKRLQHKFSLQIYSSKELQDILEKNGFKTIEQYGMDGSKFVDNKTTSILTVAKKIRK